MADSEHLLIKLPFTTTLLVTISIVYCIAPILLSIYVLDINLFNRLDFWKLLLLSSALGTLIYVFHYILIFFLIFSFQTLKEISVTNNGKQYKKLQPFGLSTYEFAAAALIYLYTIVFLNFLIPYVFTNKFPNILNTYKGFEIVFILIAVPLQLFKIYQIVNSDNTGLKTKVEEMEVQLKKENLIT